jgi:2-iminoacetate synthase ThiH
VESNNEVKMTKQEIIEMIERAGFEAVERDTVYNRVEKIAAKI